MLGNVFWRENVQGYQLILMLKIGFRVGVYGYKSVL